MMPQVGSDGVLVQILQSGGQPPRQWSQERRPRQGASAGPPGLRDPTLGGPDKAALRVGRRTRHYHVTETEFGQSRGYRDEIHSSRRRAISSAQSRAEWLSAIRGLHLEALVSNGHFLLTTGSPPNSGILVTVEECGDRACESDRGS